MDFEPSRRRPRERRRYVRKTVPAPPGDEVPYDDAPEDGESGRRPMRCPGGPAAARARGEEPEEVRERQDGKEMSVFTGASFRRKADRVAGHFGSGRGR